MGRRGLDIVLISAESLTRQNTGSAMVIHAEAYITNNSTPAQSTPPDRDGDVNPRWNHPLSFTQRCSSSGSKSPEFLHIDLYNTKPDGSSQVIGTSKIPLVRFLASAGERETAPINESWPVSTGGHLYFSYKLGAYVSRARRIGRSIGKLVVHSTLESVISAGIDQISDYIRHDS